MKYRFLIPIFFAVIVGFIFGKMIFRQYDDTLPVFGEGEKLYFIQSGIYSNLESMPKNYKDYLYIYENNAYHLYLGITKNEKLASRIEGYYTKSGNNIYIKEKYVNNPEFTTLLGEYDKVLELTSKDADIGVVEKVVIASYKEMVLKE